MSQKMKLVSIFDKKQGAYSKPFLEQTTLSATRTFHGIVNDKQTFVSKYPGDFALVLLGEFDQMTGQVDQSAGLQNLGFGHDFVDSANPGVSPVVQVQSG